MSSTFRRPGEKARLTLPGTKHWVGGITLTSTGLRDLDTILGAGQPLGTCIWVDEDRWTTSLALALIKYWCAEALSQNQRLLIPIHENENHDHHDSSNSKQQQQQRNWIIDDDRIPHFCEYSSRENVLDLLESLPRNLHLDKHQQQPKRDNSTTGLEPLGEEDEEDGGEETVLDEETAAPDKDDDGDEGLKIAWQYRKTVQRGRLGQASSAATTPATATTTTSGSQKRRTASSTQEFCHSYDLQRSLLDQINVLDHTTILEHSCSCGTSSCTSSRYCAASFYVAMKTKLSNLLNEGSQGVVRILFYRTRLSILSVALPFLISHVREHELPVVFMVLCRPWSPLSRLSQQPRPSHCQTPTRSWLCGLKRLSDVVLEVEGFAARREYPPPSEFRRFHGLLHIRKCSTVTAATAHGRGGGHFADVTSTRQVPAELWGLKRDRRKLHIELLHIPPEDFAEGGSSVGSGAVRSGAGRPTSQDGKASLSKNRGLACASSGGALDF